MLIPSSESEVFRANQRPEQVDDEQTRDSADQHVFHDYILPHACAYSAVSAKKTTITNP